MKHTALVKYTDNFTKTKNIESKLIFENIGSHDEAFISIMIPTYRRPDLLKIALESALNQSDPVCTYEVVVIDNEFSDQEPSKTEQLVREYQNPLLRYYQNRENLGLVGNWNRCIELAKGKWVAFLHDDDILLPDYINKIFRLLSKNTKIDGIMVLPYIFDEEEYLQKLKERQTTSNKTRLYNKLSSNKLMRLRQIDSDIKLSNVYGAPTCGSVFRKVCLIELGGFNDLFYPSFDWFFLYSFCKNYKLYRSMERLGYYRVFANVSLQNSTKVAFIRDRMMFRDFVAKNTKVGAAIKYLFFNEQNNTILNEEYTDYEGKAASEYFEPSETKVRRLRGGIYKLIIQGYWHTKSLVWLILG